MKKKPAKKLIEGYIYAQGSLCPACQSNQLDTGFPQPDQGALLMPIRCQMCEAQWVEIYTLTGIKDLKTKEE
ncbi:hypothetical protein [Geoalkalibacter subterraneus]|uniref:Uncharacterized protein n=1 Tax=Geoalkalibacter subterraneus TaxID=483547 RepID=A0A0B5FVX4_9BACT|nr:hypothetical protein [Geoalkalibacter subterraneus]AJF08290.1 hypothetical protein GSUB_17595 [Geoalkalibacter subterraneus]